MMNQLVESRKGNHPLFASIARWFDTSVSEQECPPDQVGKIDWVRSLPFFAMHLVCLSVIWVGWSPVAVGVALACYVIRIFSITAFYHRFFSHRTYKTSRPAQFIFAILGNSAVQRGPLWWASHHRKHHRHADQKEDVHSPNEHSILWSHMLWVTAKGVFNTDFQEVKDLTRYRELCLLDRFDTIVPLLLAAALFFFGYVLNRLAPGLHTSGMQMLIWGFFISTVAVFHGTSLINSMAHRVGARRYATKDQSRNSLILALLTLGEGWHNNHHHYPAATRQGFYWWEVDITYYLLLVLSRLNIIWDLKPVPSRVRDERTKSNEPMSQSLLNH
jgi:stearoyl-CoA desaturase (delta-9 desaturase)